MKYLLLILILISNISWAQLINTVELNEKLNVMTEAEAKKELLHLATLKSFEKAIPELGYSFDEFQEKLKILFADYFNKYKEQKIIEKFGANYKESLSESERIAFFTTLENDKHALLVGFARTSEVLRSYTFGLIKQNLKDPYTWVAKVNVDIDKNKLQRLLNKIIKGESKSVGKIILITEVEPQNFTWQDLGLESEKIFVNPLNKSWLKWFNDNLPSTVEEVVGCESDCLHFFRKWSESHVDEISIPEEFRKAIFLLVNLKVKRTVVLENLQETDVEWEGRTLLHDLTTKRVLGSFPLPLEKRTFRRLDQKALNSGIVSSLYRSPLTSFIQFKKLLDQKSGFNRVSKLVFKGYKHLGDVLQLNELLKTRGTSLGLEIVLQTFSKDEANLLCFYQGEEKSFTHILSGIKEVKLTHGYTLVNEFTGIHHVIKFVTE